jgi:hypothetical protein
VLFYTECDNFTPPYLNVLFVPSDDVLILLSVMIQFWPLSANFTPPYIDALILPVMDTGRTFRTLYKLKTP